MPMFSRRTLGWTAVALLALLAGASDTAQGCCLSWLCGGCCGPYSAGYYGGYYGGYAPTYGGCSTCGVSSGYYGSAFDGCSSCVGGGCGVSLPANDSLRPQADPNSQKAPRDQFQPGRGRDSNTDGATNRGSRTFRNEDPATNAPEAGARRRTSPKSEGLDDTRGSRRREREPESSPERNGGDFERPVSPKGSTPDGDADPFKAEKRPMPSETETPKQDDQQVLFPTEDADAAEVKTNRPDLGAPSDTHDGLSKESIIPRRTPAPIELPSEPQSDDEEPADAFDLKLDEKISTSAVSPKTRLPLHGRFGSPTIVRLKLRPTSRWIVAPEPAKLAQH